jgi:hypothetical protein
MENRLFVCGDTHIPHDIKKLSSRNWAEQSELTKDDVLIQLGDFGGIWYPETSGKIKEQNYWLDWIVNKKYTMAVVLGNHENYDIINELPTEERWGGTVKVINRPEGKIFILERGAIYTINGRKILTIGGAASIDKIYRKEGISWWADEVLSFDEENRTLDLIKENPVVDYVLTHTCPQRILHNFIHQTFETIGKFKCPVANFLDEVDNRVEFKEWHFGHMHMDWRYTEEFESGTDIYQCHYNGEPYELK